MRKKMEEEAKRMSQELVASERSIMEKNRKMYELEMEYIRSSKSTVDSSVAQSKFRARGGGQPLPTKPPSSRRLTLL
jgi:hypothetical protein